MIEETPYVRPPALFPDDASVGAERPFKAVLKAATLAGGKTVHYEGTGSSLTAAQPSRRAGDQGRVADCSGLLDDDLISHSSLRREYDDSFLNQPLRGEHRRGERLDAREQSKPQQSRRRPGSSGEVRDLGSSFSHGVGLDVDAAFLVGDLRTR